MTRDANGFPRTSESEDSVRLTLDQLAYLDPTQYDHPELLDPDLAVDLVSPVGVPHSRSPTKKVDVFSNTLLPLAYGIERESNSRLTWMTISGLSVILDMLRQICSYAVKYHNKDNYPVPTTMIVFVSECCKAVIFTCKLVYTGRIVHVEFSVAYMLPSLLYALNSNIYFIALTFTTPPVWNILMQTRVISTALVYRFYFKKPISWLQWSALVILTLAILILQFSEPDMGVDNTIVSWDLVIALSLATLAAVASTVGPIYAEYLLKNDDRDFDDKQFQMYFFGAILSFVMFVIHIRLPGAPNSLLNIEGDVGLVKLLIVACTVFTTLCGIIVAIVMKKLDNIVKLYTQAVSSGLTCISCFLLFPRMFQFDILFVVSLLLTFLTIYMYEIKHIDCKSCKPCKPCKSCKRIECKSCKLLECERLCIGNHR